MAVATGTPVDLDIWNLICHL